MALMKLASFLALLLAIDTTVIEAGIVNRGETEDDVDTNVVNNDPSNDHSNDPGNNHGNVASIVNVVLPEQSRTCRRCICTITDHCPTPPGRTCLSAASLCCCCAPRSFVCRGRDGVLQPDEYFVKSFNEIAMDDVDKK